MVASEAEDVISKFRNESVREAVKEARREAVRECAALCERRALEWGMRGFRDGYDEGRVQGLRAIAAEMLESLS